MIDCGKVIKRACPGTIDKTVAGLVLVQGRPGKAER